MRKRCPPPVALAQATLLSIVFAMFPAQTGRERDAAELPESKCPSSLFAVRHLCLPYCPPRYYRLSRPALHPNGTRRTIEACAACDPSCYTCLAGSAHNCSACPSHSTYEGHTHTCPRSPSFSYLPHGRLFGLGDTRLLLLIVAILLGLGPVAFCTFYALCRTRRRKLAPSDAESEAVSLELLYFHRAGSKESLNRVSRNRDGAGHPSS